MEAMALEQMTGGMTGHPTLKAEVIISFADGVEVSPEAVEITQSQLS
jgi:hypothetical protein